MTITRTPKVGEVWIGKADRQIEGWTATVLSVRCDTVEYQRYNAHNGKTDTATRRFGPFAAYYEPPAELEIPAVGSRWAENRGGPITILASGDWGVTYHWSDRLDGLIGTSRLASFHDFFKPFAEPIPDFRRHGRIAPNGRYYHHGGDERGAYSAVDRFGGRVIRFGARDGELYIEEVKS